MNVKSIVTAVLKFLATDPQAKAVESEIWTAVLNQFFPQAEAHVRTINGGIDEFLKSLKKSK